MNKKIKIILMLLLTLTMSLGLIKELNAASANIKVTTNKSYLVVGGEITVTTRISSAEALGSWEYTLSYDSSKLKLISGTTNVVDYASNSSTKSRSYTYKFKVIAKGTSTVSIKGYNGYAFDESKLSISAGSVKITAITQAELEASYSKNNNLSSLAVEGYELSTPFDKNTLEYTVSVPSDVEKITINAAVEDKTASLIGTGEFEVSEGENKFEIKVTAQNGGLKTYTLKINVEDKNPIEVVIDNEKYTVVKRVKSLEIPRTYEETTENINGIDVPAFKSTITNFTLIGLKNISGEVSLYLYDNGVYTKYTEINTSGIVIFPKETKNIPKDYTKTEIEINGIKVTAYKYKNQTNFYLIYGVNIETGKEGLYEYDTENSSIIKYNSTIIDELNKRIDNYFLIIAVLGVESLVLLTILLITNVKRKSKNRNKKQIKNITEQEEKENETKKEDKTKKSLEDKA